MYESFYGLTARPFQLNPDPRFFFASRGHRRAMAYLEYGLSQGEGFIVITGDVGAGKTMVIRNLFQTLAEEKIVAAHLVSTQLDADDMLRVVAAGFGLEHQGATKAALLHDLESFLLAVLRQGQRALLVVDEAQNLTPRAVEELRMLSNFQAGDRPLLQSFLLGQPEFRYTLQSEALLQLRQRVIASYHLGPMEADETRAYIEHRLHTAGWNADPVFADECFAVIHEHTGGVPRRINTLCDRLLLFAYLESLHQLDGPAVGEIIGELTEETSLPAGPAPASRLAPASPVPDRLEGQLQDIDRTLRQLVTLARRLLFRASGSATEGA
ncbi:MAG: XrtA-associated ATPase [Betaproteobacteria bacterium]|nr:XrtA-associated ATPase [Betaproteobacteria bacterium]